MKILKSIAALAVVVSLSGCGAIMHGTQQDVSISAPSNALVKANGKTAQGTSIMKLDRDKNHTVTMEKEGKTTVCGQINNSISSGIVVADIFLTGLVGIIVDIVDPFVKTKKQGVFSGSYNLPLF